MTEEEFYRRLRGVIKGERVCPDRKCPRSLQISGPETCEKFLKYNHEHSINKVFCPCYVFGRKAALAVAKGRLSLYERRTR